MLIYKWAIVEIKQKSPTVVAKHARFLQGGKFAAIESVFFEP